MILYLKTIVVYKQVTELLAVFEKTEDDSDCVYHEMTTKSLYSSFHVVMYIIIVIIP